ncbi:MAG: TetR family transcriptional regulator [Pseudomonadota bacterium]
MSRERKPAGERREEIIAAALDLAHEVGPDRITTEAIAGRIGLTQAAIFRHFPRKADIWAAAIGWLRERLSRRWAEALSGEGRPSEKLRTLLVGQFRFVAGVPALPAVLLSRELQAEGGIVQQAILGVMDGFRVALAGVVRDGQEAGEIRPGLDPDRAAFALIAMVQGTALRWAMQGRAFDLVAEGEAVVDIALDGLLSRS